MSQTPMQNYLTPVSQVACNRDKMVANFKTEESQRRLLIAVIAAHPELKLNFKAIAQHFGPEDWGEFGIEHFFRPLKKDAAAVRDVVKRGEPAKGFYNSKAWQFRKIKQDAEKLRQGKGHAAPSAANSVPATPKASRKRVATSVPSTGKSTATKKARTSTAKAAPAAPVISLDDDDDENVMAPIPHDDTPIRGPRFTETYEKQFWATDAQTPALDATQAETPNEDEDFKPHTPSDAAAFSFCQAPFPSGGGGSGGGVGYNLDTYPISQPSFVASSGNSKAWPTDDYDDEV